MLQEIGMDFDNYDVSLLPELSEDAKEKWYAKFYYQGRAEVSAEECALFAKGRLMDSAKALIPGINMDALMEPGHITGDLGYCLLDNGVGYGSACTALDEVTFEMFDWYRKLKEKDDLAYKIWYPGSHISEWSGIGVNSIEDVGYGLECITGESPCTPENLGLSCQPAEKDPDFIALLAGNGWVSRVNNPDNLPIRGMCLFHYVRRLPSGGTEFRTHFYIDAFCKNGHLIKIGGHEPEFTLEMARRMLSHCIYERNNLRYFLPEMYHKMEKIG